MTTLTLAQMVDETSLSEVLLEYDINTNLLDDVGLADLIDEVLPQLREIQEMLRLAQIADQVGDDVED